jgi:dTDP-4-dehydrorhamnose reductase
LTIEQSDVTHRILVTGASGLLGSEFVAKYSELGNVTGWFNTSTLSIPGVSTEQVDLRSLSEDSPAIERANPNLIIHCGAITNVDWCESNSEETFDVNSVAAERMAQIARKIGARFVFISTDSVFDGESGNYRESDPTGPINVYASSKVEAETLVSAVDDQVLIVRCNFFGNSPSGTRSLMEWVLNRAKSGEKVPGFTDSVFSPLAVPDLVSTVMELVDKNHSGLIHVGSNDAVSKFEFAQATLEAFGLDPDLAIESSMEDIDFAAKRPKNTNLNVDVLESILERPVPSVRDGLRHLAAS